MSDTSSGVSATPSEPLCQSTPWATFPGHPVRATLLGEFVG